MEHMSDFLEGASFILSCFNVCLSNLVVRC